MFSLNFFKNKASRSESTKQNETCHTVGGDTAPAAEGVKRVYNLILLDSSGSMMSIYRPALTGVNETLQTIRAAQKENGNQEHFVSLVSFDSCSYNRIYNCTAAQKATDISEDQYRPGACTPLYDAMGRSITELRRQVGSDDVVLVTVITDGYENASHEYSAQDIKNLVDEMRKNGWVFTYIGANQDVESVAKSISINNYMEFSADEEGTAGMFVKERSARRKLYCKVMPNCKMEDLQDDYFE